ncbi:Alcohol dehydrogenase transcription factor Myb/SANT-like family protein [Euphorbia peplus]|nr:Alcohol dehydrogenase transcription factor Myb/SANT-like family protein [Euphorbia peplus]
MSAPHSAVRRVPPPCWTQQETIALIHAYRDKWFSVNRGNLRAADWDAVSSAVAQSSSGHPPKSSLQCRHKIEKLRKRYRAEKRRSVSFPGRSSSSSSWDLFPLLDDMAIGSSGSKQCVDLDDIRDGFRLKSKFSSNVDQGFDRDHVLDVGLDPNSNFSRDDDHDDEDSDSTVRRSGCSGNGFYPKPDMNSVSVAFRSKDYKDEKLKPDIDFQCGYQAAGFSVKSHLPPQVAQFKGYGKIFDDDSSSRKHNFVDDYGGDYIGFPLRTLGDVPLGKCRKIDMKSNANFVNGVPSRSDKRYRLGDSVGDCLGMTLPLVSRPNGYGKVGVDSGVLGNVMENNGGKKLKDPFKELVSAISMSTDSFVKMEKMKMEMAMEIEKMQMDNLLKHNQMILESQQQIVDAFVKGASKHYRKKRKKEYEVVSLNGNSEFATTNCAQNNIFEE